MSILNEMRIRKITLAGMMILGISFLLSQANVLGVMPEEEDEFGKEEALPFGREIFPPEQETQKQPRYAPGEVLVKFKEGAEPQTVLEEVNLEVTSIERVHSIKPPVAKFKKEYKLEKDPDGWYWFRGKNYQEIEDISDEEVFQQAYQQMSPLRKGLYRSYKISLPEGVSVEEAVAKLESRPDVEYAQPNYIMQIYMVPNSP